MNASETLGNSLLGFDLLRIVLSALPLQRTPMGFVAHCFATQRSDLLAIANIVRIQSVLQQQLRTRYIIVRMLFKQVAQFVESHLALLDSLSLLLIKSPIFDQSKSGRL